MKQFIKEQSVNIQIWSLITSTIFIIITTINLTWVKNELVNEQVKNTWEHDNYNKMIVKLEKLDDRTSNHEASMGIIRETLRNINTNIQDIKETLKDYNK